jgi:hypothetical protein
MSASSDPLRRSTALLRAIATFRFAPCTRRPSTVCLLALFFCTSNGLFVEPLACFAAARNLPVLPLAATAFVSWRRFPISWEWERVQFAGHLLPL